MREHLYFLPIGGTAMASLAGLLQAAGHRVEGVDSGLYPPMSTLLESLDIPVRLGFDPSRIPDVDRVVVGNAVGRTNPEVLAVVARRLPMLSQAEAVAHYLLAEGREALVVAGTHGKTTTTAMLAWILERAGEDPTTLVGGLLPWSRRSFRLGAGRYMVIEGDEYNAAYFDRGPKFLHYRPRVFVLGPVEFDHADLYPDLNAVLTAFRAGSAQVPRDGAVVVNCFVPGGEAAVRDATAPRVRVGPGPECELRARAVATGPDGGRADLEWRGRRFELALPLAGVHNVHNAAMAVAAAAAAGIEAVAAAASMAEFPGVVRRLEPVGEAGGVQVVDDFAHHPTALAATVAAARARWPDRRLVVAFEPRSLSAARAEFQDAYVDGLGGADVVLIATIFHRDRLKPEERLDCSRLARELRARGVDAFAMKDGEDAVAVLAPRLAPGDVVLGCSSGDFSGFHRRLLAVLAGEPLA